MTEHRHRYHRRLRNHPSREQDIMTKPPREESEDAQRHEQDLKHHPDSKEAEEESGEDE